MCGERYGPRPHDQPEYDDRHDPAHCHASLALESALGGRWVPRAAVSARHVAERGVAAPGSRARCRPGDVAGMTSRRHSLRPGATAAARAPRTWSTICHFPSCLTYTML